MRKTLIAGIALSCALGASALVRAQVGGRAAPGSVNCIAYHPATLRLTAAAGGTWKLEREDGASFRLFANRPDADAGLAVFKEHNSLCYIGRGNGLPDRTRYVMEFLR